MLKQTHPLLLNGYHIPESNMWRSLSGAYIVMGSNGALGYFYFSFYFIQWRSQIREDMVST